MNTRLSVVCCFLAICLVSQLCCLADPAPVHAQAHQGRAASQPQASQQPKAGSGTGAAGGASSNGAAASGAAASGSAPSGSSTASGSSAPAAGGTSGTATYYTFWSTSPGSCGSIPTDPMIVAVPPNLGKAACGKCVTVNYQGKSIKVKVTDTCADCDSTHIDLSNTAFQQLAPLGAGKISVNWSIGAC